MARTRESMGTGTPKRRKKEGEFDRINEKHLPIPSKKTCWEIHLHLLEMPASVATPPAKRSLMSLRTTTSHSSSHLSPLSIEHHTHPSLSILLIIPLFVSSTLHLSRASWPSWSGRGRREPSRSPIVSSFVMK